MSEYWLSRQALGPGTSGIQVQLPGDWCTGGVSTEPLSLVVTAVVAVEVELPPTRSASSLPYIAFCWHVR